MYNNWLQKLTESYTQTKRELTESEMILEELNETKEYAYILEHILDTLLEHEIINEEMIMEVFSPVERFFQMIGKGDSYSAENKRRKDLNKVRTLTRKKVFNTPYADEVERLQAVKAQIQGDATLGGADQELATTHFTPSGIHNRIGFGGLSPSSIPHAMRTAAFNNMLDAPSDASIKTATDTATNTHRSHRRKLAKARKAILQAKAKAYDAPKKERN